MVGWFNFIKSVIYVPLLALQGNLEALSATRDACCTRELRWLGCPLIEVKTGKV